MNLLSRAAGRRWMCGATYVVALACGGTADGSVPLPPPPDRDEGLRLELLQRAKRDQQMAIATIGSLGDSTATANLAQIFTENAQYLRTVLDTHGWPGRALVGTDGADAAWTIVQHADGFPEMQERALKELEKAVAAQQAEGQWYAWLADRLAKNRRLPQIYGTQVDYDRAGNPTVPMVEDPTNLNARRAKLGLAPIESYLEQLRQVNAQLRAARDSATAARRR